MQSPLAAPDAADGPPDRAKGHLQDLEAETGTVRHNPEQQRLASEGEQPNADGCDERVLPRRAPVQPLVHPASMAVSASPAQLL